MSELSSSKLLASQLTAQASKPYCQVENGEDVVDRDLHAPPLCSALVRTRHVLDDADQGGSVFDCGTNESARRSSSTLGILWRFGCMSQSIFLIPGGSLPRHEQCSWEMLFDPVKGRAFVLISATAKPLSSIFFPMVKTARSPCPTNVATPSSNRVPSQRTRVLAGRSAARTRPPLRGAVSFFVFSTRELSRAVQRWLRAHSRRERYVILPTSLRSPPSCSDGLR